MGDGQHINRQQADRRRPDQAWPATPVKDDKDEAEIDAERGEEADLVLGAEGADEIGGAVDDVGRIAADTQRIEQDEENPDQRAYHQSSDADRARGNVGAQDMREILDRRPRRDTGRMRPEHRKADIGDKQQRQPGVGEMAQKPPVVDQG